MASDTELEIVDAFNRVLPRLPSMGIRVGLDDVNDLKGLATLLDKKFGVLIKKFGGELEKQTKTQNANTNKIEISQQTRDEKFEKNAEKRHKELVQSLRKKGDDLTNSWKDKENFYINMLKKTIDGVSKVGGEQLDFAQVLVDLNKSGVVLTGGFKSLSGLAFEAGQTSQMFAKNLAKMTPTITKLNGVIGNGAKIYSDQYKQLRAYGMAQDDANAAFEYAINQLTPAQLREMEAHNTLSSYIQQTSQQLLKLRDATGKSIETITRENDLKNRELRLKAWTSNPQNAKTYQMLQQMGLNSPEIMDYLLTGIPDSKLTLAMAGNRDIGMLLPMLSQSIKSGQGLTAESVGAIQKKLRPIYNQSQALRQNRAQYSDIYAAARNENFQWNQFANLAEGLMNYGFDNIQTNANDNQFVKNVNNIEDAKNRAQEFFENTMRGGFEGVNNSMKILSNAADKLNDTLVFMNKNMQDISDWMNNKFGTTVTGVLGTLGAVGLAGFGSYIKDWATAKIMNVGTMIVGHMVGDGGGYDTYADGGTDKNGKGKKSKRYTPRRKNGTFKPKSEYTKLDKMMVKGSKYLKPLKMVGKYVAGVGTLLDGAEFASDISKFGALNTYDIYKNQAMNGQLDVFDYLNPTKWMPIIEGKTTQALHYMFDSPSDTGFKESKQNISTSAEQVSKNSNEMKEIMKQSVEENKMTNMLLEDFIRKLSFINPGIGLALNEINVG